jgi:hypothetical protein
MCLNIHNLTEPGNLVRCEGLRFIAAPKDGRSSNLTELGIWCGVWVFDYCCARGRAHSDRISRYQRYYE